LFFKGDDLHPVGKIFIGVLLLLGSAAYVCGGPGVSGRWAWADFLVVLNGMIPPLVFLIGLFVVWLELDELRIERELAAEEKKARRKKKR
jgi:hypothetical protein